MDLCVSSPQSPQEFADEIVYGLMRFEINYYYDIEIPNYWILMTSNNLEDVAKHLEKIIILNKNKTNKANKICTNKNEPHYLIYETDVVHAQMISYCYVMSHPISWVKIYLIKHKWKLYWQNNNNVDFYKRIYACMNLIRDYVIHVDHILELPTAELIQWYVKTFGKKPKFIFGKRRKMIRDLIAHKQKELTSH